MVDTFLIRREPYINIENILLEIKSLIISCILFFYNFNPIDLFLVNFVYS